MNQIYVIKDLDVVNGKATILDSTKKYIEVKVYETEEETKVISTMGVATVLGFITNPNLISDFSYGEGKPFIWDSEKKELLRQCEDTLAIKPFKRYSIQDRIMLSEWKPLVDHDNNNNSSDWNAFEEYDYYDGSDEYTYEELEDMYRGAFEGDPSAEWNID